MAAVSNLREVEAALRNFCRNAFIGPPALETIAEILAGLAKNEAEYAKDEEEARLNRFVIPDFEGYQNKKRELLAKLWARSPMDIIYHTTEASLLRDAYLNLHNQDPDIALLITKLALLLFSWLGVTKQLILITGMGKKENHTCEIKKKVLGFLKRKGIASDFEEVKGIRNEGRICVTVDEGVRAIRILD